MQLSQTCHTLLVLRTKFHHLLLAAVDDAAILTRAPTTPPNKKQLTAAASRLSDHHFSQSTDVTIKFLLEGGCSLANCLGVLLIQVF